MSNKFNLPPTPRLMPAVDRVRVLSEEVLALRILLAAVIWKLGGDVAVTNEEIGYVATHCKLDTTPTLTGQKLSVSNPGILDPGGVHDA